MNLIKKIPYFLTFFFLFLVLFFKIPVSNATTTPLTFYDWSSTLEVRPSNVLGEAVSATEPSSAKSSSKSPSEYKQFNRYLIGGELTQSNPFYFIKPLQENLQLAFTFNQKTKDQLRVQIAGERLDEMQKLATTNNIFETSFSANSYHNAMQSIYNKIASLQKEDNKTDDILKLIEEETAKHNIILEQVRVQAPSQVESSIKRALEASWKNTDSIADIKDRPAVPPDLVSRLQSIEAQGLLTSEEVNKLISVKSRMEAREEIGKYVNEGIVSESDYIRLDETTKSFYPDDFYKIHEILRFQELQKLEEQKPDDATLNKIQSFAKTYEPGDQVPTELRKYWIPVVRLEEIQNTLRPDLIDANLFKQHDQKLKKFNEVVERFKPRPEDIALVKNFIQRNNVEITSLPPEYQRMYNLGLKYGAQCGSGYNWIQEPQNPVGGYCVPKGSNVSGIQNYDEFAKGKSCTGNMVSVKNSNGVCSVYASDCIPPGWNKTDSCVATPTTNILNKIECPSNSHFVPVSYDPNGGYCIPNYTQVGFNSTTGTSSTTCPAAYHRNYAGGPCVPDYNPSTFNNPYSLPRYTATPGGPYYTNSGQCGNNSYWVPEPVNPQGGYCMQNQGTNNVPRTDMGNCRNPGECYDYCKTNPNTASCAGFNSSQPRPGDTNTYRSPSREAQEAACRAGGGTCVSWVNEACGCERSGSTTTNYNTGNTSSGNTSTYESPSMESQEAACRSGGGTCVSWMNGACGCERSNSGGSPPSGYGTCPSDQYWNGSGCQQNPSSSTPSESPASQPESVPTSAPTSSPPQ